MYLLKLKLDSLELQPSLAAFAIDYNHICERLSEVNFEVKFYLSNIQRTIARYLHCLNSIHCVGETRTVIKWVDS